MDSSLRSSLLFFIGALILAISLHPAAAATAAYPTTPGAGSGECSLAGGDDVLIPPRREVHGNGRIFDISHRYVPDMPVFESKDGIGYFLWLQQSMKNGSIANNSEMKIPTHTGTHVDAPGHVFDHYFDAGFDVDTLDLEVLNGPALLVDVPRDTNITGLYNSCFNLSRHFVLLWQLRREFANFGLDRNHRLYDIHGVQSEVMKSLHIPRGVRRVLFRTLNTDRRLMFQKEFDASYVGFTLDGAKWLAENTDIKLLGVDYLSVIVFDDLIPAHLAFLEGREIILVEAVKLDDVPAGVYSLHCLPLRLVGAEGSPIRCILIK